MKLQQIFRKFGNWYDTLPVFLKFLILVNIIAMGFNLFYDLGVSLGRFLYYILN
ncbi:MAG: hypothetical protein HDT22_04525 [Ruminococcus sp.]|nr:hypothetical protein [Ruminococcus sp.]